MSRNEVDNVRTWTFPSQDFPAPVGVAIETPEGWNPVDAPGVDIALGEPVDGASSFRSNVVVNVIPQTSGFRLEQAASELGHQLVELEDAHVFTDGDLAVNGGTARVAEVAYVEPGVGTLIQSHLLTTAKRSEGFDLVHATATCAGDRGPDHVDLLREILSSVRTTD